MKPAMLAATALLTAAALGARAEAQTAATAATPATAPVQVCTTTTTVVRRGDVVVSNTSVTKCEDEAAQGGGAARAVFAAPGAAVRSVFNSGVLTGGGDGATASNVRGDWRVVEAKTERVCHLSLTSQPAADGFKVRGVGCAEPLSRADAWTFDNGDVLLHGAGGLVLRLAGNRDHLAGATDAGDRFELAR